MSRSCPHLLPSGNGSMTQSHFFVFGHRIPWIAGFARNGQYVDKTGDWAKSRAAVPLGVARLWRCRPQFRPQKGRYARILASRCLAGGRLRGPKRLGSFHNGLDSGRNRGPGDPNRRWQRKSRPAREGRSAPAYGDRRERAPVRLRAEQRSDGVRFVEGPAGHRTPCGSPHGRFFRATTEHLFSRRSCSW